MKKATKELLTAQVANGAISAEVSKVVIGDCNEISETLKKLTGHQALLAHCEAEFEDTETLQFRREELKQSIEYFKANISAEKALILECFDKLIGARNEYLDALKIAEYSVDNGDFRDVYDTRQWHLQAIKSGNIKSNVGAILAIMDAIETTFATEAGARFLLNLMADKYHEAYDKHAAMLVIEEVCGIKHSGDIHDEFYRESIIAEDLAETVSELLDGVMSKIKNPSADLKAEYNSRFSHADEEVSDEDVAKEIIAGRRLALDRLSQRIRENRRHVIKLQAQYDSVLKFPTQKKLAATADKLTPITTRA